MNVFSHGNPNMKIVFQSADNSQKKDFSGSPPPSSALFSETVLDNDENSKKETFPIKTITIENRGISFLYIIF